MKTLAILLVFAAGATAAPNLKEKGYSPDGWVDALCNQSPEQMPWLAMQKACDGMDREAWIEVGREMSKRMRARFKRLGIDGDWPSCFDFQPTGLHIENVSGTLFHYKWLEANKGRQEPWMPPADFWIGGKVGK